MRGDEEGVLGGVVEGVLGSVLFGLTGEERMERVAAGRPVRNREVVFMLAGRSAGGFRCESLAAIRIAAAVRLDVGPQQSKEIERPDD